MPDEMVYEIGLKTGYPGVVKLCGTNKRANEILCHNNRFWYDLYVQDFKRPHKFDAKTNYRDSYRSEYLIKRSQIVWELLERELKVTLEDDHLAVFRIRNGQGEFIISGEADNQNYLGNGLLNDIQSRMKDERVTMEILDTPTDAEDICKYLNESPEFAGIDDDGFPIEEDPLELEDLSEEAQRYLDHFVGDESDLMSGEYLENEGDNYWLDFPSMYIYRFG